MNSSNSFNICPHCNNSNSLNARYCARCGSKLVVPEEVVVCPKCHTRNSPLANFCRNCGTAFKADEATKICPKCGRTLSSDSNVCACGYSFATVGSISPSDKALDRTDMSVDVAQKPARKAGRAGGRAFAIIALVFLLAFAYLIVAPASLHFDAIAEYDNGIVYTGSAKLYGYELILNEGGLVDLVKNIIANPSTIASVAYSADFVLLAVLALFVLIAVIHLIVVIVRIFTGKRSKRGNWLFFIMAAITTVACLLMLFPLENTGSSLMTVVTTLFQLDNAAWGTVGYNFGIAIPVYFWLFFLYSLIAKRRAQKVCDCCEE